MTKKELATKVAKSLQGTIAIGITAEQAEEVINHVLSVIKDAVYCGNEVTLRGFGTFGHKNRQKENCPKHQHRRNRDNSGASCREFQTGQRF